MRLTIKNNQLKSLTEFINSLTFNTGSAHIAQARIVKLMSDKFTEFDQDRVELVKSYAKTDDKGEPIVNDGKADIADDKLEELNQSVNELLNSNSVIDLTEYEDKVHQLQSALENYNRDLTGDQSLRLVAFLDGIKTKEND